MSLSKITLEATVIASSDQIACDVGDEVVVLNLKDGVYYGLNPVAALVWRNITEETKVSVIRDVVMKEYDVQQEACTNDLFALLTELANWRLVEIRNGKSDHSGLSRIEDVEEVSGNS